MWKSATTHVRNGNYSKTMADKEAQQLLDTARLLRDEANKTGVDFINSELDISHSLANKAWALCATGRLPEAKLLAIAATTAYQTAKKFLPNLGITAEQRAQVASKIGTLTPGIERLAMITLTKSLAGLRYRQCSGFVQG